MNRVLSKRIARELKSNAGRYLALVLLIVMGVFLVVSFIGSAEAILQGTENKKKKITGRTGSLPFFCRLVTVR